jgi:hypothetical protein
MKWTELLAAGTVAWFVWSYFTSNNVYPSSYARPIDNPVIQAKIAAIKPYRDYSDVVQRMEAGTWYGGL